MVGGLEILLEDLANALIEMKVEVSVITTTPNDQPDHFTFKVLRNPSFLTSVKEIKSADFYIQFNVSLKGIPAWSVSRRPLVLVFHNVVGSGRKEEVKQWISDHLSVLNIGCSQYIAGHYKKNKAILNAYNETLFANSVAWETRSKDLIFVGRLVSDKGAEILIKALAVLHQEGLRLALEVVGKGPEEEYLKRLTSELQLQGYVSFHGEKPRSELGVLLNEHKIMVVPSLYKEPFGIVALEGLASGCFVIVSEYGGLIEAIGPCGFTFPNGDAQALAATIKRAFTDKAATHACLAAAPGHLAHHSRGYVAQKYLDALSDLKTKHT